MPTPFTCLILALAQSVSADAPVAPFAPGIQWAHTPEPEAVWVADDVAFLELEPGAGELVWASRAFQSPGLLLLGAQEEQPAGPLLAGAELAGALLPPCIATSAGRAFVAYQLDAGGSRRTTVERRAPDLAQTPVLWSRTLDGIDGGARLAARGDALVLTERLALAGAVRCTSLDPETGATRASIDLPGGTVRALDLSDDGSVALVLAGERLYLLETATALPLLSRTHQPAPRSAALASNGAQIALGRMAAVELWSTIATDLAPEAVVAGGAVELAVALDLSDSALAVGWWNSFDARSLSLELWSVDDAAGPSLASALGVPPVSGALQNFVADVDLAGERAAFGLWGAGGDEPEVVVLERGRTAPVLTESLAGSVRALALEARAERVAVARKDGHANLPSATGAVELLDTGERDLALSATPRAGATLRATARPLRDWLALLAVGTPGVPTALPPLGGSLGLDPTAPVLLLPFPGATTLPTLDLAVPPTASSLPFGLQLLHLDPAGSVRLGHTAVRSHLF